MSEDVTSEEVEKLYEKLNGEAKRSGYHLNPDMETTMGLVEGLLVNTKRYGYQLCPCRLGTGDRYEDLDIICPCDYRDPDLDEYDTCYCALYVSKRALDGEVEIHSIPERRPPDPKERNAKRKKESEETEEEGMKVWRCKVCGYLCAREQPPEVCPICKASRDRFEVFEIS